MIKKVIEMKKIFKTIALSSLLVMTACDLDLFPETGYNEGNVIVEENQNGSQFSTRAEIKGLVDALYANKVKNIQEKGYMDYLVYAECRADNAYGATGTQEVTAAEANKIDAENFNVTRDWGWYLAQVNFTNNIICNIDSVMVWTADSEDPLTQAERDQWISEAYCWKSWALFQMSRLWGNVPLVNAIPPAITAENIEEVYDLYYPAQTPVSDVHAQIIKDMTFAAEHCPDVNPANKFRFSKAFAHGMLARTYAEAPHRDWSKVKEHCEAIEAMDYKLVDNYGDMWGYNETDAVRNTSESIFEITFSRSSGNWVNMMFHRNAFSPNDNFGWSKWVTPSRDLIAAYDKEGDTERKNACIVFDKCVWSGYYPNTAYAFMHKLPTNASSIILMRLGEIKLLHAEALAELGDLEGAARLVNEIRKRAGIKELPAFTDKEEARDAVLHERRLELAFEGFRFFDLARHGFNELKAVHDGMHAKDKYWQDRIPLTPENLILPVPSSAMDLNPSLVQNPGY